MTAKVQTQLDLKAAIEDRRAARSFRSDPIAPALLQEIFRLGTRAPSGFNLQPWRFIVVQDPDKKQQLHQCAFNQRQVVEAPVVLICCGDRQTTGQENIEATIALGREHHAVNDDFASYMRNSIPSFFENHPSFGKMEAWINRHVMLAVAHLMVVAKSFGVDSCPMEGFSGDQIKAAFNIPETVDICCLLPLGYAAEPFKAYGGRFPLEQVFFSNEYGQQLQL